LNAVSSGVEYSAAIMAGNIPRTIFRLVEPAVWSLAARLLILTTDRKGSNESKPTVATFYETGIVTSLYEAMLMSAVLSNYDIRHEERYKVTAGKGAPKQVDLWLRPYNGGNKIMIEAGDFSPGKVHRDLAKLKKLNPKGTNWFLAFFRKEPVSADPMTELERSFKRKNGLKATLVKLEPSMVSSFDVFRPDGNPDKFGAALLRGL
jgi:hypothetical protein